MQTASVRPDIYPAGSVIDGVSGIFVCGMKLFRKFALIN